jgi:2-polyprenyl-6-methoxyphenol hydroxylase-like FAD-dependent oxidoreductase
VLVGSCNNCLADQGQGGGVAMEDAVSLAVLLPLGTSPGEVPERLALYEKIRYERAHKIQHYTRLAGQDLVDGALEKLNSK